MIRNLHRQLFAEGKFEQIPNYILKQLQAQQSKLKDITAEGQEIEAQKAVSIYDLDAKEEEEN